MRTMGKSGTHCLRRIFEGRTTSMTMLSRGDQQRSPRQSGWETEGPSIRWMACRHLTVCFRERTRRALRAEWSKKLR